MPGQDAADIADILTKVAETLENSTGLDPDGAVRLIVFGHIDMPYVDNTPGADMFDEVVSLIDCYIANEDGDDPDGSIDWIPPARAAAAARAEAKRWRAIAARR
ncbi:MULTISPECIES: hypothetical protein [unclassified Streptomyces]|uniref:hypothetical protein n=1 Tax=unclassified Streptomyces TaxID=2593676 RepID=UPI00333214FE